MYAYIEDQQVVMKMNHLRHKRVILRDNKSQLGVVVVVVMVIMIIYIRMLRYVL